MNKKIYIFDWQYWTIIFSLILLLLSIPFLTDYNHSFSLAISRLGAALGFAISFFQDNLKNKIKRITVDYNTISFDSVKNFKNNIISFNRKDIVACKMFIYTTYGIKICLHFEVKSTNKSEFIDIYYECATLSVVKQLFNLKKHITNFAYDVSPENTQRTKSIKYFLENNFKYSLKDKIYYTIVVFALLLGVIIVFYVTFTLNLE